jgi:hypothetical protein
MQMFLLKLLNKTTVLGLLILLFGLAQFAIVGAVHQPTTTTQRQVYLTVTP